MFYQYHPDSYPLEVLSSYLTEGKKAPLYQVLVEDKKLSDNVNAFQYNSEIAGQWMLQVTAFSDKSLQEVYEAIEEGFKILKLKVLPRLIWIGFLRRTGNQFLQGFVQRVGQGFQLAQYEIFAGDPGFVNQDVKNILAVTAEDVMRVYNQYVKDKNFVATSFIRKEQNWP